MDSPKKPDSTWTQESPQVPPEEHSADTQIVSEELAKKNLPNLALTPNTELHTKRSHQQQDKGKESLGLGLSQLLIQRKEKRHGVRTLEAARKERMIRMMEVVIARTVSLLRKNPQERKCEIERRSRGFVCSCNYCRYHEDPSDNVSMENNYDMKPTEP